MGVVFAAVIASALFSVPAEHRKCEKDQDCTTVVADCGQCDSCGEPVRWAHKKAYVKKRKAACEGYQGPVCDAKPCGKTPVCVDGTCQLSEKTK